MENNYYNNKKEMINGLKIVNFKDYLLQRGEFYKKTKFSIDELTPILEEELFRIYGTRQKISRVYSNCDQKSVRVSYIIHDNDYTDDIVSLLTFNGIDYVYEQESRISGSLRKLDKTELSEKIEKLNNMNKLLIDSKITLFESTVVPVTNGLDLYGILNGLGRVFSIDDEREVGDEKVEALYQVIINQISDYLENEMVK